MLETQAKPPRSSAAAAHGKLCALPSRPSAIPATRAEALTVFDGPARRRSRGEVAPPSSEPMPKTPSRLPYSAALSPRFSRASKGNSASGALAPKEKAARRRKGECKCTASRA